MFTTGIRPLLDGDNLDQSNGVDSSGPAGVPAPGGSAGVFTSITDSTGPGSNNVGAGASPGSGGTTTVSTPGSGLVFVNTYAAGDTAAYEADIVAAEQTLESLFTNKLTLNVTFAESNEGNNGDALSNSWPSFVNVSYATLKSALPASVDTDLPATDPNPAGGKDWALPEAYARMLGLSSSTPTTDDTVTLNNFYGWDYTQDIVNGIEHELTEGGMGRVGGLGDQNGVWSTMDLFRFSAANTPDYTDGRDGKTTYFSSNGTTLSSAAGLSFNNEYSGGTKVNSGDTADWTQEQVFGSTGTGESLTLVQTELNVMQALGWNTQMQEDFWVANGAGNWWTVNTTDWSAGSTGADYVPITPQDAFIGFLNTAQVTSNNNETVNSIGTNTVSTLTIGNGSTFTATNGTVLNSTDVGTTVSGMLGTLNVNVGSTLVIGNTFDNAGTLTIGVNSGSGGNGNLQILGSVTLNGSGTVNVGQYDNQTFSTGTIETYPGSTQFFVNGALTNVNNTITGAGTIDLYSFDNQVGGTVEASQEEGDYLQVYATSSFTNEGSMVAETRATLDLGQDGATRSLTNTGTINLDSDGDLAISGTFTIAGSGDIGMKGAGADIVSDGLGAATFINESVIAAFASGQIGDVGVLGTNDLTFDNDDGTVFADGPGVVLTFNTGSHTITDNFGGLFEAENGAQLVIDSKVNTGGQYNILTGTGGGGTIEAAAGSEVTISAAIAPGGSGFLFFDGEVLISGSGTIDVTSGGSISTPITFSGSGGTLEVDSAADSITGQISGFAMGDFIDARFASFGPGVTALWQENGSDTGGVLSLVDGSSTLMTLNLAGVYTTAEFATLDDGHGGTTIELTGVPHDFNADGYSDILFQNVSNGNVYEWEMNGTSVIGSGSAGSNSNPQWQVVGTGNFLDNGYSDILFENVSSGNVYEYEMNGTSVVTSGLVGNNMDPTYQVRATGDFTGDGYSGALFENSVTGQVYEWQLNGLSVTSSGPVGSNNNPSWQIVGTGDFFDNGISDALFENVNNGNIYEWQLNGTSVVASGSGLIGNNNDPTWHVVGTGDFTGNGIDDILFQNSSSGQLYEWQMNGTSVVASGFVGNNTDPTWQVVGTGDFTGTHTAGILFQNVNSGVVIEWQVNGFSVTNMSVVGNNTNPAFHVVGHT